VILLVGFALAVATVPLFGGRLSRLADVRLRWAPLVLAAVALQVLVINVLPDVLPGPAAGALHLVSYGAAGAFLIANRAVPGLWVAGTGGLCNLAAIAANGGVMPASRAAQRAAGIEPSQSGHFVNSGAVDDARLAFLGDVFAIPKPLPLANVFSIGDVLLIVGAAVLLHRVCGSRLSGRRRRASSAGVGVR
jgi:hypothetical protein